MAKSISHNALDAAFGYIADRADTLVLCSGVPATVDEALTPPAGGGRMLGSAQLEPGLGNGNFAVAPGLASGRRLIVGPQDRFAVVALGLADHLAIVSRAAGEVLLVTALSESPAVEPGSIISLTSFSDEIADPV